MSGTQPLNKEVIEERNEALVSYLQEDSYRSENPETAQVEIFAQNPQFDIERLGSYQAETVEIDRQNLSRVTEELTDFKTREIEKEIVFYSDGTHMICTFEVIRDKNPLNKTSLLSAEQTITGSNMHQRYDGTKFLWRTWLTVDFRYNGVSANIVNYGQNHRLGDNVVTHPAHINISNPYGSINLVRVQRLQSFTEHPGAYGVGDDDLRVSCNMQGKIMKN